MAANDFVVYNERKKKKILSIIIVKSISEKRKRRNRWDNRRFWAKSWIMRR